MQKCCADNNKERIVIVVYVVQVWERFYEFKRSMNGTVVCKQLARTYLILILFYGCEILTT